METIKVEHSREIWSKTTAWADERDQCRPKYLPSSEDFSAIMEGVACTGLKPTWHKKQLDNIDFPECQMD